VFDRRSFDVLQLPAAMSAPRPSVTEAVAVVARDDIVARRIEDALMGVIQVWGRVADVLELSEGAGQVSAIILASDTSASDRKALIRSARRRFPETPVIVIASASSNGIYKALEAGAAGFVFDARIESTLAATIRAVCVGQVVVPHQPRQSAVRPALSHREKQTLALVAIGLTNREIADRLFLAESTVKTHLTAVFGKLGVNSRTEAAALVLDPEQKLGLGVLGLSGQPLPVPNRNENQ
jgi:DNA-binding NarL/FixJ family response regulator